MIKNYTLNYIMSSPLKKKLIKYYNYDQKFISLVGNFYITPDRFLPICSESFSTSTDLFGFYENVKYSHLFTLDNNDIFLEIKFFFRRLTKFVLRKLGIKNL